MQRKNRISETTYDAAGRQAAKTDGTYTTINNWRFADMLYKVETDDPNVPDVTYDYGGNGMRRQRTDSDGAYTWYNYVGFSLQSEEDALGALDRTYIGRLADLTGPDPGTATARYFTHDILFSTRGTWDGSKSSLGTIEYTPYGAIYTQTLPPDVQQRFALHPRDAASNLHYAAYRYYDPSTARWLKRDPFGMIAGPNMYGYVLNNPVKYVDPFGASPWTWLVDQFRKLTSMFGRKGKNGGNQAEELNDHFVSPTVKAAQDTAGLDHTDENNSYPGLPILPAVTPMVMPVGPDVPINDFMDNVAPMIDDARRREREALDSQNWPGGIPPEGCDGF